MRSSISYPKQYYSEVNLFVEPRPNLPCASLEKKYGEGISYVPVASYLRGVQRGNYC